MGKISRGDLNLHFSHLRFDTAVRCSPRVSAEDHKLPLVNLQRKLTLSAEQTLAQVAANVRKPEILAFQAISGVHLRKPLFQRSRMVVTNPHEGSDMVFHEFLEPSSLNI